MKDGHLRNNLQVWGVVLGIANETYDRNWKLLGPGTQDWQVIQKHLDAWEVQGFVQADYSKSLRCRTSALRCCSQHSFLSCFLPPHMAWNGSMFAVYLPPASFWQVNSLSHKLYANHKYSHRLQILICIKGSNPLDRTQIICQLQRDLVGID